MKKIIVIITILLLVTACTKENDFIKIDLATINNKIEAKEDFILFVGSSECSVCKKLSPTLKKAMNKEKVNIFYLDASLLNETEVNSLVDLLSFDRKVPKVFFMKKGTYNQYETIDTNLEYDIVLSKINRNK